MQSQGGNWQVLQRTIPAMILGAFPLNQTVLWLRTLLAVVWIVGVKYHLFGDVFAGHRILAGMALINERQILYV